MKSLISTGATGFGFYTKRFNPALRARPPDKTEENRATSVSRSPNCRAASAKKTAAPGGAPRQSRMFARGKIAAIEGLTDPKRSAPTARQYVARPPERSNTPPVVKEFSSVANHAIIAAASDSSNIRPRGILDTR